MSGRFQWRVLFFLRSPSDQNIRHNFVLYIGKKNGRKRATFQDVPASYLAVPHELISSK